MTPTRLSLFAAAPAAGSAIAGPPSQVPIQVILIGLIAASMVVYFTRLRSRLLDRLLVLAVAGLGAAMVVAPDATNGVANAVGVNRGADLVFYVSLLGLGFLWLLLFSKVRESEQRQTELARAIAIQHAHRPEHAYGGRE